MRTTACKNCLFAKYENNTQTNCSLNKLDLFKSKGHEVVEAYDEEKEFFIIPNKYCYWYRDNTWKHRNKKYDEQVQQLTNELKISYNAIVFTNNSVKDLNKTLKSLASVAVHPFSALPPKHISVVRPINCEILPHDLVSTLESYNIPWRVQNVVDPKLTREDSIDLCIDIIHYQYYMVCDAGYFVDPFIMSDINYEIFYNLYSFIGVVPSKAYPVLIMSYILHKLKNGSAEQNLLDKVRYLQLPTFSELLCTVK